MPIAFAFTGQPIQIVITYTIVSSLFVPFVAATILISITASRGPNRAEERLITNLLLVAILLFAFVARSDEQAAMINHFPYHARQQPSRDNFKLVEAPTPARRWASLVRHTWLSLDPTCAAA